MYSKQLTNDRVTYKKCTPRIRSQIDELTSDFNAGRGSYNEILQPGIELSTFLIIIHDRIYWITYSMYRDVREYFPR